VFILRTHPDAGQAGLELYILASVITEREKKRKE